MKSISFWGSRHPVPARWAIFASIVLLNFLAIHLAWWAFAHKVFLPFGLELGFGLAFLGLCIYPAAKWKGSLWPTRRFYIVQKTADALLILGTFMLFFSGTQRLTLEATGASAPYPMAVVYDMKPASHSGFFGKVKEAGQKVKVKVQKHIVKRLEKHLQAKKRLPLWAQIALSVGALIVGVFLWYLLVALACSLSCSGQEALAVIVFVGGTLGVLALLVWAGLEIWKRREPKPAGL